MTSRTSRESKPRPLWSRRPRWRHAGTGCKHYVRDTRSALVGRSDFCAGLGGISWEATEQPPRKAESYRRQSGAVTGSIAEMVLRGPPFTWRCAPPVPRQSDSSAKRTPPRWGRQSSSPLRSGLAVEVWWLRMQSRLICCQPRIHQEARGFPPFPPSPGFGRESVPIDAQQWYCHAPCFEKNKVWGHCRLLLGETDCSARPGLDSLRTFSLGLGAGQADLHGIAGTSTAAGAVECRCSGQCGLQQRRREMNLAPLRTELAGTHRQMDLVMVLSASAIGSAVEGSMPAGEMVSRDAVRKPYLTSVSRSRRPL